MFQLRLIIAQLHCLLSRALRMSSSKINDHLHGVPTSFVGVLLMIGLNLFGLRGILHLEGQKQTLQSLSKFITMQALPWDRPWMVHHKGSYLVFCILFFQVAELVCHFNLSQYQLLVCPKATSNVYVIAAA